MEYVDFTLSAPLLLSIADLHIHYQVLENCCFMYFVREASEWYKVLLRRDLFIPTQISVKDIYKIRTF